MVTASSKFEDTMIIYIYCSSVVGKAVPHHFSLKKTHNLIFIITVLKY